MKISLKSWPKAIKRGLKKRIKPVFLLVLTSLFCFPHLTESQVINDHLVGPVPEQVIKAYYNSPTLPQIPKREPRKVMVISVTAYNSEPGQTDSTPFTTAFGTKVRDGIVATNFLPKGTVVRFPEAFGDKEFVVEDRMNARYYYKMDIWMADRADAVNFGNQLLKMEIL
ncbi:MAG: hypothetical protein WC465_03995 [Patescibacteria group bacterium]